MSLHCSADPLVYMTSRVTQGSVLGKSLRVPEMLKSSLPSSKKLRSPQELQQNTELFFCLPVLFKIYLLCITVLSVMLEIVISLQD